MFVIVKKIKKIAYYNGSIISLAINNVENVHQMFSDDTQLRVTNIRVAY